jgi:dTMP kinase
MSTASRAWFVAFEGGEATGKSTQAQRLAERTGALLTREPGGTPLGLELRAVLLDHLDASIDARAEALLMAADRAQHVAEVVRPALEAGRPVVTDRYIGSSLAYQGFGRGLPLDEVAKLSRWATGGLLPDAVVLLTVDFREAARRRGQVTDRVEAAGDAFHRRVTDGYMALAADDPERWVVIDGAGDVDGVEVRVWDALRARGMMAG